MNKEDLSIMPTAEEIVRFVLALLEIRGWFGDRTELGHRTVRTAVSTVLCHIRKARVAFRLTMSERDEINDAVANLVEWGFVTKASVREKKWVRTSAIPYVSIQPLIESRLRPH